MAYDKAEWHSGGEYPEDLPPENGGTHMGMFLAWAIHRGLEGELHREDAPDAIEAVRQRRMTGREFLFQQCDGRLTDDDFSDDGNAFARAYYDSEDEEWGYMPDYATLFDGQGATLYHVADSWENFDRLAPIIDRRLAEYRARRI
jgi:hypothetical protein